jgi:rsbT antagonist protein RsbS
MDRIPILKMGDSLVVSIQEEMHDRLARTLQDELSERIYKTSAKAVLIDISTVQIVDSFIGRMIANIAGISGIMDARTVIIGIQPAVAITLVEMGIMLHGVMTALTVEDGMQMLARPSGPDEASAEHYS